METIKIKFVGTVEEVEAMIRIMDKIFRSWWNVYGAHRDGSWHNKEGYNVIMSYTAGYNFYNIYDISRLAWHKIRRIHFIREEDAYFTVVH